jgi:glycosyltransferase involved in cell wall biosynthesis
MTLRTRKSRPLHIVIDARCVRDGATGVGHYVAGLLRGIDALLASGETTGIRVSAICLRSGTTSFSQLWVGLKNITLIPVDADYEKHPAGDWFLQVRLPRMMRRLNGQVLVSPFFFAPWGPRKFARVIGVLDDLIWSEPQNYPSRFRNYMQASLALSLPFAEETFTLSKASSRALKHRLRPVPRERLDIVPGAVDAELFRPEPDEDARLAMRRELGIFSPLPLAVCVASFETRKNHSMLIRALRPLADEVQLALVGHAPPVRKSQLATLAGKLRVHFVAPNSHETVAKCVRSAELAVLPSRNEGFGLPALEAMACGLPVVASDIPAFREVLKSHGRFAPCDDPEAWTAAVREALSAPETAEDRGARVERAGRLTWKSSALRLIALSRRAAHAD